MKVCIQAAELSAELAELELWFQVHVCDSISEAEAEGKC